MIVRDESGDESADLGGIGVLHLHICHVLNSMFLKPTLLQLMTRKRMHAEAPMRSTGAALKKPWQSPAVKKLVDQRHAFGNALER